MDRTHVWGPPFALLVAAAALVLAGGDALGQQAGGDEFDWRSDWELGDGLTMETDTQGYNFPAQIVFVPDPGPDPKDPLYFVVELKGNVRVVTNDRTVRTFAADFLPNPQGESFIPAGAAGICLDPKNGYVFATFAYLNDAHVYRNGIVRFKTEPGRFGLEAGKTEFFLDLFKDELSAATHQIGPCQVKDDQLYVTVGFGEDRSQSQNLNSTLGSILRMTLDFAPLEDNPFYQDDGHNTAIDYIWAYGFRNPFGLKFVGDRLFATENGGSVDRFNEIEKGENYLWDGTDWGMGARAAQLFFPAIGIVHLDFIPESNELFPQDYRGRFVAAAAGAPGTIGPGVRGNRSVLILDYDFEKRRMARAPKQILKFRGEGTQVPVAVALGPDALYFVHLLPNQAGVTPVYKIRYDPTAGYPYRLGASQSPQALVNYYQCRQCHEIQGQGGKAGPAIDATLVPRLAERLNAPAYEARVAEVDEFDNEPFVSYREARKDILSVAGEERVRRWLPVYLREPKFDNPDVEMPTLGLSETQAKLIAEYLVESTVGKPQEIGPMDRLRFAVARLIPELRYRHMAFAFVLGGIATTVFLLALYAVVRRRPSRR